MLTFMAGMFTMGAMIVVTCVLWGRDKDIPHKKLSKK
jgi:hypothetical protein